MTGAPFVHSLARRLATRFALLAFALYHIPLVLNAYPTLGGVDERDLGHAWGRVFGQLGLWVARHVFGRTGDLSDALSGSVSDSSAEYGRLLVGVVLAAAVAILWSLADRTGARWVEPALRVLLRYTIAIGLASYAVAKLYPVQFAPLSYGELETRVGELRPMGVLWTLMSTSRPYSFFAGAMELLVVVLLAFRRTATLGALLCLPVLANVALMNFCYDVPIKLLSTSFVLAASVLVALDAGRILAALGLRPVSIPPPPPRAPRLAAWVARLVLIGGAIASSVAGLRDFVPAAPTPLDGIWQVQSFVQDGRELVGTTDPARWRRLAIDPGRLWIRREDETWTRCTATLAGPSLALEARGPITGTLRWQLAGKTLRLDGRFGDAAIAVRAERTDEPTLISTTFHGAYE